MQPEHIVVIPPTHEQSTPSFHVESSLAQPFLAFLKSKGIVAWQPPAQLEKSGPDNRCIIEIEVEAGTPETFLESLVTEFLERGHVASIS